MSINHVCISGNLTRDAEVKSTGSSPVVRFGIASNERRKNPRTDEWEDYPNYVDCVMFGNYAEKVADSLRKGVRVVVDGSLRWSQWEKDGAKRSKLEVIAREIVLPPRAKREEPEQPYYDDDIPF